MILITFDKLQIFIFVHSWSASKHEGEGPRELAGRGHILFDALTQFMKSSALKQMDEIVGFV